MGSSREIDHLDVETRDQLAIDDCILKGIHYIISKC